MYAPRRLSLNGDPRLQRPHVTITEVGGPYPGHLIFGSSSETEAEEGAWWEAVPRGAATGVDNGLHAEQTYFYPGILLQVPRGEMVSEEWWAFAPERYTRLMAGFRFALGLSKGTASRSKLDHWRGRIVPLKEETKPLARAEVALVLTEPRYSRERCYQLLLPLLDGSAVDPKRIPPEAVLLPAPTWAPLVGPGVRDVLAVPMLLLGLRHKLHVDERSLDLTAIATPEEISRVEDAMARWFRLPAESAPRKAKPSEMRKEEDQRRLKQYVKMMRR